MAKQTDQNAGRKAPRPPANWGSMTAAQKAAWRKQYQGIEPTARTTTSTAQRAGGQNQASGQQLGGVSAVGQQLADGGAGGQQLGDGAGYDQGAGQQLGEGQRLVSQEEATQTVAQQIADSMGELDLRAFVAAILRGVADALESGGAPAPADPDADF